MSKLSYTTSSPKISTQLPQKSAWARGPPRTPPDVIRTPASPTRSQSPALPPQQNANPPARTRSRRSSTFGQKGVTISRRIRGHVGSSKPKSLTFGSTEDDNPPIISSSPADVPPIKTENVRSFGSVPTVFGRGKPTPSFGNQKPGSPSLKHSQSSSTSNPLPPIIFSPSPKVDIHKLFPNHFPPSPPPPHVTAESGPFPSLQDLQNNASTFNPRAGFQKATNTAPPGPGGGIIISRPLPARPDWAVGLKSQPTLSSRGHLDMNASTFVPKKVYHDQDQGSGREGN